ncbi:hypothetical protein BUE93_20210 [Chromobacterium amazonense]|uniref:HTH marR-type domain-containing protein n=1 Tax=Chromobacterium amazonense TaxID=1382803 RepID=A0A2S9WZ75_9NEIS|nr:MarR family winged helix-turn-helix transcriptional regulator [Chromobacterium amazonense]PRP68775.1 hypothetical protein BUE93_20210 [Chromobacterium amazonense]
MSTTAHSPTKAAPLDTRMAVEMLYLAHQALSRLPDAMLARYRLTRLHHRVLFFVGRYPRLSVSELGELLDVSKQAVSPALQQLINRGLIGREAAPHDNRVKLLWLTEAGQKIEAWLHHEQQRLLQRAFDDQGETASQDWFWINRLLAAAAPAGQGEGVPSCQHED